MFPMALVGILISLLIGGAVGTIARKNTQKTLCPFCECAHCCSIGHKVDMDKSGTKGCCLCLKGSLIEREV